MVTGQSLRQLCVQIVYLSSVTDSVMMSCTNEGHTDATGRTGARDLGQTSACLDLGPVMPFSGTLVPPLCSETLRHA